MRRFIIKKPINKKPQKRLVKNVAPKSSSAAGKENNTEKKKSTMTTSEKIAMANEALNGGQPAKRIKKDKGLIERTESSTVVLTEDNKELLKD